MTLILKFLKSPKGSMDYLLAQLLNYEFILMNFITDLNFKIIDSIIIIIRR